MTRPDGDGAVPPSVVSGEIADFLRTHEQRRRQLPRALVVGLLSGLIAVAFRLTLESAERWRERLYAAAHGLGPAGILLPALVCAACAGIAVALVRGLAPEASGSGIPHLKAVLHHLRSLRWGRVIPVKFVGGSIATGAGLALGREGPTIQMGGAVGEMVSGWFGSTPRERQTLIAAGAGAGLAAAFNAPLAGLVFVLEELQRDFAPAVFATTLIASATADVVTRSLMGQLPVFHTAVATAPPLAALPVSLLIGLLAALLGVLFNRTLVGALDVFQRASRPAWVAGAAVGAVVGVVGWFAPAALGGGGRLIEETLAGRAALAALPLVFLLRFGLTMISYGSGAPGGIFAPLLVLGAELGLGMGALARRVAPLVAGEPVTFAVVGMAALFSAIVRAPLTGMVLMVEMTGSYALVLPLLVACLTAYGIADFLGDRPVYEALLERDLLRGQPEPELSGTLLLELVIAPGAPFDGRRVRELALPPGCILVTVRRGLSDSVPTADLQLAGGDRITAVVAREAAGAVALLRTGAGASR